MRKRDAMFAKNIFSGVLLQGCKILFKFVFSVLVARILGADEYGKITFFFLILNIVCSYGHLGVINGISYFSKHDICRKEKQFNTNVTYLLLNVIVIFIGIVISPIGKVLLPDVSWTYRALGVLYVFFTYMYTALEAYYIGREEVFKANGFVCLSMLLAMVGMLICFVFNKISFEVYVLLQLFEVALIVILLYVNSGFSYSPAFDKDFFKRELKYGNIIFWASLFGYMNYRVDQLMIKYQMGDSQLGIYSVAVTLAELVLLIPNSIMSSIMGRLLNAESENEKKRALCITIKGTLYLCVLIAGIGFVCTPLIGILYGHEYKQAEASFIILLVGVCAAAMGRVIHPYYLTRGEAKIHLYMTLLAFVTNICLNSVLIPNYGIEGAAFASTCSYFVYGGVYLILLRVREKIGFKEMLILSRTEAGEVKRALRR